MSLLTCLTRLTRPTCLLPLLLAVLAAACSQKPRAITFNNDVAPILYENCATCHRPIDGSRTTSGDPVCFAGAPFSVLDYGEAARHAKQIASAAASRRMPPWLPADGYGDFAGARRLHDDQIALLE